MKRKLVKGKKTSIKETQKKTCEKYRNVVVDEPFLTHMSKCLFDIISDFNEKYSPRVFPTTHEIMLRHEIGFQDPCPKIAQFSHLIRDFLRRVLRTVGPAGP